MIARLLSTVTVLLAATACANGRDALQPTVPPLGGSEAAQRAASAAQPIQTSGRFDAIVDFSTVTLTPRGRNCLLQVSGRIVFHGTIEGTATGRTSALEFGPCAEVALNPPGTFPDVFKSVAAFTGTIAGQPAHSDLLYMGRVQQGGAIDGRFIFSNGVAGELDVNAIVAVGGTYRGSVVVR
jgi:hypothetical protein